MNETCSRPIYAISYIAVRYDGAEVKGKIAVVNAVDSAHAIGMGMQMARADYPTASGWHSHGALAVMVPDDAILERAAWLNQQKGGAE